MNEYADGFGNELYQKKVPGNYIGKTFSKLVHDAYGNYQVIPIAVKILISQNEYHITLNPVNYVLSADDIW